MNQKDRQYQFYLDDILISMNRIAEYIGELEFIQFKQQYMIVDAVIRNFEIIGEAAKHIPEEICKKYDFKMETLTKMLIEDSMYNSNYTIYNTYNKDGPQFRLQLTKTV